MAQAWDREFTEFIVGCLRRLLHAGDLLTGNRGQPEDLVQHALAKAYERWPSIRDGSPEAPPRSLSGGRSSGGVGVEGDFTGSG